MFRNTIAVGPFFPWITSRSGSYDSEAIRLIWGMARDIGLQLVLSSAESDARRAAAVSLDRDMLAKARAACWLVARLL